MNAPAKVKRRGFLGAALVGVGGTLGVIARKMHDSAAVRKDPPIATESRFVYDVSEFEKTDSKLVQFTPADEFPTGFKRVKSIAIAPGADAGFWVTGDKSARWFKPDGAVRQEVAFDRPPHGLQVTEKGELFVGFARHFECYSKEGARILRAPQLDENSFITSLAVHGGTIYLADAGRREVVICDRQSGTVIDRFGRRDEARGNPGFEVPSPYFDLAVLSNGRLRIVNPGRLRVETYTLDGRFEGSWGQPGLQIDRFCGCCNPVHFAVAANGNFVTSEKGLARIKVYSPAGEFKAVVAGMEILAPEAERPQRSSQENRGGSAFDVAIDPQGRVLALDPYRNSVRVFAPRAKGNAA